MKKINLLSTVFILSAAFSYAQKVKVAESSAKMSLGSNNALIIEIPEADVKEVEKGWKKLMKDYDAKVSDSKNETFAYNALIKAMTDNTMDVYAVTEKTDNGTKLSVFFDLGGAYLSSSQHSAQFKTAEKIVYDFGIAMAKEAVQEQLRLADKEMKKMENEQEKLIKNKENLHKDIENYKAAIVKAENDIKTNEKDQETLKGVIQRQKETLELITKKLNSIQ